MGANAGVEGESADESQPYTEESETPEAVIPDESPARMATEAPESAELNGPEDEGMGASLPILGEEAFADETLAADAQVPVPPPSATRLVSDFTLDAIAAMTRSPVPEHAERVAKPELVDYFITNERLDNLWARADELQQKIKANIHSIRLARLLLDQIRFARNEILAGRDRYEDAERFLSEVDLRIELSGRIWRWSYTTGLGLFVYELFWAVLIGFAFLRWIGPDAFREGEQLQIYLFSSLLWGSFGGVIGGWLALVKHVAREQDFDRQYTIWYLASPLMGIGVGAFVFLVIWAGLISLSGPGSISSPLVIYILAWLAGYQQNVFTDLVRRILRVFKIDEGTPQPSSQAPPTPQHVSEPDGG